MSTDTEFVATTEGIRQSLTKFVAGWYEFRLSAEPLDRYDIQRIDGSREYPGVMWFLCYPGNTTADGVFLTLRDACQAIALNWTDEYARRQS